MAFNAFVLIILNYYFAAGEHGVYVAVDHETLPSRVVHVHVVGFVEANFGSTNRIVDDNVGI